MRNGYVKESSSELSVCFDAVHHVVLYLTDNKFQISVRHTNFGIYTTIYAAICLQYFVIV